LKGYLSAAPRLNCKRACKGFYGLALVASMHFLMPATALAHPGIGDRIHLLDDEIATQPDNQYFYIQRSLAHSENGSPQKAMQDIQRANTLGDAVNAAFVRGVVLYRQGNFNGARQSFDQYLAAYPEHVESLEYRARLLRDAGQNKAALADFVSLFALNPAPNPGLYISAADLMVTLPSYGSDAAITLLDTGMSKLGPVTQLQRHAIALEQQRGNYPAAISRMNQLPASLRSTPHWKIDLAKLYWLNSDQTRAQALLLAARSQLDELPRNGMRDAAREELLHMQKQLASELALERIATEQP
jgi:tetratricopeptide (TPR) repeat protein